MDESDSDDEDAAAAAKAVAEASALAAQKERDRLERESMNQENGSSVDKVQQPILPLFPLHRPKLRLPPSIKISHGDYLAYFHGPDRENYPLTAGPYTRYGAVRRKKIAFSVTLHKPTQVCFVCVTRKV